MANKAFLLLSKHFNFESENYVYYYSILFDKILKQFIRHFNIQYTLVSTNTVNTKFRLIRTLFAPFKDFLMLKTPVNTNSG